MTLAKMIVRAAAVTLLAVTLTKASGFEVTGVGVQAQAMGGAFRALANDWTAAYYNPAGYAFIPDNQLGGAWHFLHYRNTLTPDYRFSGIYENGVYNDIDVYNKYEVLDYPSGGFVARVPTWGKETVIGLSAYQSFDYNLTWRLYEPLNAYNDSVVLPNDQYRNNLDVVVFQATAAREFQNGKLALGLGLQVLRADLLFHNTEFRTNPIIDRDPSAPEVSRPLDHITSMSQNDGKGWGFGLNAGALFKATPKLNVGVTAKLPFDVTVKGKAANVFYMPYVRTLQDDPDYALGTVKNLFVNGDVITDSAEFKTKIQLPPSIGIGFAFTATEKLKLTADFEWTFWSHFEGLEFTYTDHHNLTGAAADSQVVNDFFTANRTLPVEWSDAGKVMLGAQYQLIPAVELMAGFSADQSPSRDARFVTPLLMDIGSKLSYHIGGMAHIKQWDLGITTGMTTYPDRHIRVLEDKNGDGAYDNFPGTYQAERFETALSVNYRF